MTHKFSHKILLDDCKQKQITIVLPVRVSVDRADIIERLQYPDLNGKLPDEIAILVVDDGSPLEYSQKIIELCNKKNYSYLRLDTEFMPISMARARNAAATQIQTKQVLFQDVDLLPYPGFYQDLVREVEISGMNQIEDEFIMFGVIYLTEESTKEFTDTQPELRRQKFINYLLENNTQKVEKFSTGTSVIVFNRHHYLSHGGNSEDFEKWGFEDIEFACRVVSNRKKFPLPERFDLDYRGFSTIYEYKGWKSIYRLFGDMTFFKGMVMFHSWHPVNHDGDYKLGSARNKQLFEQKLSDYRKFGIEPRPLPMKEFGTSLVLKDNPWTMNRQLSPLLGNIIQLDGEIIDPLEIQNLWNSKSFDRAIFFNPYANENILKIYQLCRQQNIPYYVIERGALPDSIFFDPHGFNADSISYDPSKWDFPLTEDSKQQLISYISNERTNDESLEKQSVRVGKDRTKSTLGINPYKKVLFVPLQRPSDTVITYFSGRIGNFDNFTNMIAELAEKLKEQWVVVVKKHPLETQTPDIPGTINANNVNIKDLLDIADKTLLINSGVGVLSLIWGVPVLHAGEAFYGKDGLAKNCSTTQEVLDNLNWTPDQEKVYRFLAYLTQKFYSFGKFTTRIVPFAENGGMMSSTSKIDFYTLRVPHYREIKLPYRTKAEISDKSVLFDRYKGAGISENKIIQTQTFEFDKNTIKRKWRKFKKNPKGFFLDSKNPILHKIGLALSYED